MVRRYEPADEDSEDPLPGNGRRGGEWIDPRGTFDGISRVRATRAAAGAREREKVAGSAGRSDPPPLPGAAMARSRTGWSKATAFRSRRG